jgi:O-antigen ligase
MDRSISSDFFNAAKVTCAFFVGVALVLNSFTLVRGDGSGGPFEILLLLSLIILGFFKLIERHKFNFLPLIAIIYLLVIMAPLTFLNSYFDQMGSSIRTLFALFFGAFAGFIIANTNLVEQKYISLGGASVLIASFFAAMYLEIDFSNLQRLLFLSENPNQIALYSLGMLFLISWSIENKISLGIFNLFALGYGFFALSDTFFLAFFIIILFFLFGFIVRGKAFSLLMTFWVLLIALAYVLIFPENVILEYIIKAWQNADEGGGRLTLALNGILAYLESPIFGHGAGAFSGVNIPMMRYEAHNTFIDFLTMGGIPFILIVYVPFFLAAKELLLDSKYFILGILIGLVIFSFFHFIGRHPIFWFVWGYSISIFMHYKNLNKRKLCAE